MLLLLLLLVADLDVDGALGDGRAAAANQAEVGVALAEDARGLRRSVLPRITCKKYE